MRDRLIDALLEGGFEERQLTLSTDEGGDASEDGAGAIDDFALATQLEAGITRVTCVARTTDVEADVEEPRGDVVDGDRPAALLGARDRRLLDGHWRGFGALEEERTKRARGAIDDVADRQPTGDRRATRHQHHRREAQLFAHRQRTTRRLRCAIGRCGRAFGQSFTETGDERAIGEHLEARTEGSHGLTQSLGARRNVVCAQRRRELTPLPMSLASHDDADDAQLAGGDRGPRGAVEGWQRSSGNRA